MYFNRVLLILILLVCLGYLIQLNKTSPKKPKSILRKQKKKKTNKRVRFYLTNTDTTPKKKFMQNLLKEYNQYSSAVNQFDNFQYNRNNMIIKMPKGDPFVNGDNNIYKGKTLAEIYDDQVIKFIAKPEKKENDCYKTEGNNNYI